MRKQASKKKISVKKKFKSVVNELVGSALPSGKTAKDLKGRDIILEYLAEKYGFVDLNDFSKR